MFYRNGKPNPTPWWKKHVYYPLSRLWNDIRHFPRMVKYVKYGLQNFWAYKRIIWEDRDWDYSYIYHLLRFKLARQADHMEACANHIGYERRVKELRYCVWLLDRILEGDLGYIEEAQRLHDEKWGKAIWDFVDLPEDDPHHGTCSKLEMYSEVTRDKPDLREQEREEQHAIYERGRQLKERDKRHLFNFLNKKIEWWWD